ncbi:MAG: Hpt domain-containing protein, partial [Proteobacteria bacterium]|nr:Hpt domain-containing protein [Pseudomonadota bacterium]
ATRLIRSMAGSKDTDADLPILAMTANIFEEDRQACMEAGMNDFVAKPFDLENLFSTILKWLPQREVAALAMPPSAPPARDAAEDTDVREQLAAVEGMDAQTGLRNMRGDVAGYLRLLRQFDTAHGDDMQKLGEQLAKGEADAARRLAHTVKGAAGTLGLKTLQEAARALEENLRSQDGKGDADEVSRLMDALNAAQNNFHEALIPIIGQATPMQEVKPDPVAAQQVLARLILLLEKDDTAANALFLQSEALLKSTYGATSAQLGQQLEAFDYPAALTTIQTLCIAN